MTPSLRRRASVTVAALLLALVCTTSAPQPASAVTAPLKYNISARIHMGGRMHVDATATGRFTGSFDFATGKITGTVSFNPVTIRHYYYFLDVTTQVVPTKPLTGSIVVSAADMYIQMQSALQFNVKLLRINDPNYPTTNWITPCQTKTPITLNMKGLTSTKVPSTFFNTFSMPEFTGCGLDWYVNYDSVGDNYSVATTLTPVA